MKKLILISLLAVFAMTLNAQTFSEDTELLYSDTTVLAGGDVFIRNVYSFLPTLKPDGDIECRFQRIYIFNGEILTNITETYEGAPTETVTINGSPITFQVMYDNIVAVNRANWKLGMWQTFLQKVYQ